MLVETLLHSIFFVVYTALALFILNKNTKDILNQSVFLLMVVSACQNLSLMVVRYPLIEQVVANVFMDILSISMTTFAALVFLSLVYLTRIFKPGVIIYTLLTVYVLGFAIFQLYTDFASVSARNATGIWIMDFNNQLVLSVLDVTHNSLLIAGFILLIIYIKKNRDELKIKQAKVVLFAGLISYFLSLTNVLFSYLLIDVRLPMLNDLILSIFLIGFVYSIVKFELFEITPSMVVEQIIRVLPIGLIIADSNAFITRTNNALCSITGHSKSYFYTTNLYAVFEQLISKKNVEKITTTEKFENVELKTNIGKNKTVDIFHKKLYDKFNRTIGSLTLVHDIDVLIKTQRLLANNNRRLENRVYERTHELKLAKQKAEESNRLKTEFLNNISHEIRTPMNGIIGFSKMLSDTNISDTKRNEYSKIVEDSSHQLLRIIDDILEISKLDAKQEKIKETAFYLNDVLTELFSIFSLKSKNQKVSIYLKKELPDNQSYLKTDQTKLNKILSSLIENALKFTGEGIIEIGYFIKKTDLVLYVKDTGIGISPENQKKIFERFAQEEKEISYNYGGLGLGLSISKQNARLIGADITLKSKKGEGSTFYVTIPYKPVQIKNRNTEYKRSAHNLSDSRKYKILVAEDEKLNYLYIEALFEENTAGNYTLIHAKNGKEAVDICLNNNDIDIVLMDIKMPVMNGLEATKKIKSEYPELPVIAQTAYSSQEDKELTLKNGCDDCITKPIIKKKLFELITKYIDAE